LTELARPLILNDPLDAQMALAIGFEKLGNPGTALIPLAQISIDL